MPQHLSESINNDKLTTSVNVSASDLLPVSTGRSHDCYTTLLTHPAQIRHWFRHRNLRCQPFPKGAECGISSCLDVSRELVVHPHSLQLQVQYTCDVDV